MLNNDEDASVPLPAFAGVGIELEYMIVDRDSLSILPVANRLLHEAPGSTGNDVERGMMGWSNELVLHLIEIKNPLPSDSLAPLPAAFQEEVRYINRRLESLGARLMPGAMHPWMDPRTETRLWPHDNNAIYRAYDRIFDCRSHGWANLQSMHINLPFADDREFERLHAAIRLVLPVLPALAASSPIAEGRDTGWADYRMHVYAENANAVPSIAGMVIPETITSRAAYEQRILAPMYRDIAPHDPDHVLRYEWLNSRGAIARFDRNTIEIRVIDTQECPLADLAIAAAATGAVRMLYEQNNLTSQQEISTPALASILEDCMRGAEKAVIDNAAYLQLLGLPRQSCSAGELWRELIARTIDCSDDAQQWYPALHTILSQGPLSRRILRAVNGDFSRTHLLAVYRALCDCAEQGRQFTDLP